MSILSVDLDGDRFADVVSVHRTVGNISVQINDRTGQFGSPIQLSVGSKPEHATAIDLNGDNRIDLAVANTVSDNVTVLLNLTFPPTSLDLNNNDVPDECECVPVLHVDEMATGANSGSSWADAFTYLQDALDLAATCIVPPEIWVATGTYKPDQGRGLLSCDRSATFQLLDGVGIYGGFAGTETSLAQRDPATNVTTLSGDLDDNDNPSDFINHNENVYHVITSIDNSPATVLDGFIISGGNANSLISVHQFGAGIYCGRSQTTISNCTFNSNFASHRGGAIYNIQSSPRISNCKFSSNVANDAGGAISNIIASNPNIVNCVFDDNRSTDGVLGFGGAISNESLSTPLITNCLFFGNIANTAGAIYNEEAGTNIVNSTFYANIATNITGGIHGLPNNPIITNSILWDNSDSTGSGLTAQLNFTDNVTFSCIKAWGTPGIDGNNNLDPSFEDPSVNNLRLMNGSPCINSGNDLAVPADIVDLDTDGDITEPTPFDLDLNPRFEGIVDMGAYEEPPCTQDVHCADGMFCNGVEICDANNNCISGDLPCVLMPFCDEQKDTCNDCFVNLDCDDGIFCNGVEKCKPLNTNDVNSQLFCYTEMSGILSPCSTKLCDTNLFEDCCNENEGKCIIDDACPCERNSDCDDGNFCNGIATCDKSTEICIAGTDISCPREGIDGVNESICDEFLDDCVLPCTGICPSDDCTSSECKSISTVASGTGRCVYSSNDTPPTTAAPCYTDAHCVGGEICEERKCKYIDNTSCQSQCGNCENSICQCTINEDCPAGAVCFNGICTQFAPSRFLSIIPPQVIYDTAIRVELVNTDGFPCSNGDVRWLGPPHTETYGNIVVTYSFLQCCPFYMNWSNVGMLHVYGSEIVPESSYKVQAIKSGCNIWDVLDDPASPKLELTTGKWGDIISPLYLEPSLQPDIFDVLEMVDAFLGSDTGPTVAAKQDNGGDEYAFPIVDEIEDISDVLIAIDTWLGKKYVDRLFTRICNCDIGHCTTTQTSCNIDANCVSGNECINGICTSCDITCQNDADCNDPQFKCISNICISCDRSINCGSCTQHSACGAINIACISGVCVDTCGRCVP